MPRTRAIFLTALIALATFLALTALAPVARAKDYGTPSRTRLDCMANYESEHRTGNRSKKDPSYVWQKHRDGGYFGTGYPTKAGNGGGRYQFEQGTWNGAVKRAGYPQWAGRRPSSAPSEVQDAAAVQLHRERGLQPWPTPNRHCHPF